MTEAERALLIAIAKDVRDSRCADPAHIQRLIIAAQAPANAVPPNAVKIPESEEEAALMGLLGTNWLEQHAPHRLKPDRPKIVATEPSINIDSELNRKWTFSPNSMPDTHHFGPKSAEPKPSAYGHQEHCNYPGSPCTCEEPKPSAGVSTSDATIAAAWHNAMYPKPSAAVSDLEIIDQAYLGLWDGVCPGHAPHTEPNRNDPYWDGVKEAIRRVRPLICAAKDADTATVIADDDERMAEIERLKRSLELYRKDNRLMREQFDTLAVDRSTLRYEIERLRLASEANAEHAKLANHNQKLSAASLKDAQAEIERLNRDLVNRTHCTQAAINARREMEIEATRLTVENQALRHPDIDAAADRAREAWIAEQSPQMNWVGAWRAIARAVYGIDNKHPSTTNQRTSINEQD